MATFPTKRTPDQRTFVSMTVTTESDGLSDVADFGGLQLANIEMSTAWTDAPMTFLGSAQSSAELRDVFASGGLEVSFTTTASRMLSFDPWDFAGMRFLQLRSGDSATGVAQAAARTIVLDLVTPGGPVK